MKLDFPSRQSDQKTAQVVRETAGRFRTRKAAERCALCAGSYIMQQRWSYVGLLRHLARVCASCFLFDSLVFVFMGHATVFYVVEDYVRRFTVYVRCHSGGGAWPIFRLQQVVACVLRCGHTRRHTEMMKNIYAQLPTSHRAGRAPAALNSSPKSVNRVLYGCLRSEAEAARARAARCSRHRMDATRGAITWSGNIIKNQRTWFLDGFRPHHFQK